MPIHKWPIYPISVLFEKFYPRNINQMPAVKFFAGLDLDQICLFLDGRCFWVQGVPAYATSGLRGRALLSVLIAAFRMGDPVNTKQIIILGIGCTLLSDQGFGVRMIQILAERFEFPDHVHLIDGGLLGVGLTGTIAQADHLIVIDALSDNGSPGDIYRLEGRQILQRLAHRNHVQQVEFLEALAHCQALESSPQTVLLGIEPDDTKTLACELTPVLREKIDAVVTCVLEELDRLAVSYRNREKACV